MLHVLGTWHDACQKCDELMERYLILTIVSA